MLGQLCYKLLLHCRTDRDIYVVFCILGLEKLRLVRIFRMLFPCKWLCLLCYALMTIDMQGLLDMHWGAEVILEIPRETIQWFLKTIHKIEEESSGFSMNINLKIIGIGNIFLIKSTKGFSLYICLYIEPRKSRKFCDFEGDRHYIIREFLWEILDSLFSLSLCNEHL